MVLQRGQYRLVLGPAWYPPRTRTPSRKQPKCPSTEEWRKMWYIHTMEYYSAIKKNEIMPFAATWMDLEFVIPSEVSQTEKEKYRMISLICKSEKKLYK